MATDGRGWCCVAVVAPGADPGVVAQLRKHVDARHALLNSENIELGGRGAPLLLTEGGGGDGARSSPRVSLEELALKQQGVQETESLWRRHVAQSKLQLDATNAAVQNAQHDNQLVENATEDTLAAQKVRDSQDRQATGRLCYCTVVS